MRISKLKLFPFLAVLILVACCERTQAAGAGVLVSTVYDNQVYVLVADHKKPSQASRGWSTLGGTVKNGETELQAAIREVKEESNGVLSEELLRSAIDPQVKTITPGFTIYYAQIPYLRIEQFNRLKQPDENLVCCERGPFIWLPWKEIQDAGRDYQEQKGSNPHPKINLSTQYLPNKSQTDWYFNAFLSTIKKISETANTPLKSTNHH